MPRPIFKSRRFRAPSQAGRPMLLRPSVERLEDRAVPATLDLSAGVLAFVAAEGETNAVFLDVVSFSGVASVRVRELGIGASITATGTGLILDSSTQAHAAASAVSSIVLRTGDKVDSVSIGLSDQMPATLTLFALDSSPVDVLSIVGTAGNDTIKLATYRFPGDFNNTESAPEDGQKGIAITRGASTIRLQGVPRINLDISGEGTDTITTDRYVTRFEREVAINVIGGGSGQDIFIVDGAGDPLHPNTLPQTVTLSDGQITIDDNLAEPEVMLGRSDSIAIDQPRAVIEIIDDSGPDPVSFGPEAFSTMLLDTGASGILIASEATAELVAAGYETEGIYMEQGVAGFTQFDVSRAYRVDFAGESGERNTLEDFRVLSSEDVSFSFLGPWGIIGMPAMVNRVVTLDMSRWSNIQDLFNDLNIKTDFSLNPAVPGPHTVDVPLRLVDFPATGAVEGNPIPNFAPLPHIGVKVRDEGHEVSGEFLVDTGAQLSIISSKTAMALGLDKDGDGNLDHEALGFAEVGGIGGNTSMPIVAIDRIAVPTGRGDTLVWTDLLAGVLDIEVDGGPKLAGVFGMDFFTSGWAAKVLPQLNPDAPPTEEVPDGFFQHLTFDFLDAANHKGKLTFDLSSNHDVTVAPNPNRMAITYSGLDEVRVKTGNGDDWVNAVPSTTVRYVLEGGPQDALDLLVVRKPPGSSVTNDGSRIQIPGYQDVVYSGFENLQIPEGENVPPTVAIQPITPNPRARPVASATFTFSEPISGFGINDIKLSRDGVAVSLSNARLRILSPTTYQIEGIASVTASDGAYRLELDAASSGIADLSGNALLVGAIAQWTTHVGFLTDVITTHPSSVDVTFNKPFDQTQINLYATAAMGSSDVTLVGASTGAVVGSLVVAADGKSITFVKTSGLLLPDTYTLTLRSAADAFKTTTGELLDGNEDGSPGGNLVATFVVAAPSAKAVLVSVPHFVRGPGQEINVPATSNSGLPISLTSLDGTATAVTAVSFEVGYDFDLLDVVDVTLDPAMPADATILTSIGDQSAVVTIQFPTPIHLGSSPIKVAHLVASVPTTAGYGDKEAIRISKVAINGGSIPSLGGDGLHLVLYPGDLNVNKGFNSADDLLLRAYASSTITALPGLPNLDGKIVGDITGDGRVTSADSLILRAYLSGIVVPQIPAVPTGLTVVSGRDPLVWISQDLTAEPGSTLSVPIRFTQTDTQAIGLDNYDLAIAFDPAQLKVMKIRTGDLTSGFDPAIVRVDAISGQLYVSAATLHALRLEPGASGILAWVDFQVADDAYGPSRLNLLSSVSTPAGLRTTALNSGGLVLVPAPSDQDTDTVDGQILIRPRPSRLEVAESLLAADQSADATSLAERTPPANTVSVALPVSSSGNLREKARSFTVEPPSTAIIVPGFLPVPTSPTELFGGPVGVQAVVKNRRPSRILGRS